MNFVGEYGRTSNAMRSYTLVHFGVMILTSTKGVRGFVFMQ